MAPKKKGKEETAPPATADAEEAPQNDVDDFKPASRVWFYGVNDHLEDLSDASLKAFRASGHFRNDFAGLCRKLRVQGHPSLLPPVSERTSSAGGEEDKETSSGPPVLALQSCLLDHSSLHVMRAVLPSALHLETVKLNGCCLEVDMMDILRQCFTDTCTVVTLHLDWMRLELPPDAEALQAMKEAHHLSAIEEAEAQLEKRRAERFLQAFREQVEARQGSMASAFERLAEVAWPGTVPAVANMWPLDIRSWISTFIDALGIDAEDSQRVFDILDNVEYGPGDGFVSLKVFQDAFQALPLPEDESNGAEDPPNSRPGTAPSPTPEFSDPIGSAFAAFLDKSSPLEIVSFRSCGIGRLETKAIASALASPSPHLRALNLWGNRVCNRGAAYLARALEANFGLQFLGLGCNLITDGGLETLCKVLGQTVITDKALADKLIKSLKDQHKDLEKKKKAFPPPPKDGNGRDRYWPEPRIDICEESKDDSGSTTWIWTRNDVLKTLNLEQNQISDSERVERLQPFGMGTLILRSTPCAPALLEKRKQRLAEQAAAKEASEHEEAHAPSSEHKGWKLILQ